MSDNVIGRILAIVEKLDRNIEELRHGQDQLRTGQDQLRTGQDQLRIDLIRTRTDVMERIDRMQDALTARQEGEVVTLGVAERAERMAKATQDDVRIISEQVTAMFRQIRRLQSDVEALRGGGPA